MLLEKFDKTDIEELEGYAIYEDHKDNEEVVEWLLNNDGRDIFGFNFTIDIYEEMYAETNSANEVMSIIDKGNFILYPDCYNMEDVAYQIVDEIGILNDFGKYAQYFDYDRFGSDLEINGCFIELSSINAYIEI